MSCLLNYSVCGASVKNQVTKKKDCIEHVTILSRNMCDKSSYFVFDGKNHFLKQQQKIMFRFSEFWKLSKKALFHVNIYSSISSTFLDL